MDLQQLLYRVQYRQPQAFAALLDATAVASGVVLHTIRCILSNIAMMFERIK